TEMRTPSRMVTLMSRSTSIAGRGSCDGFARSSLICLPHLAVCCILRHCITRRNIAEEAAMRGLPQALLVLALQPVAWPSAAQDYPTRPVKAIVAVGAGGTGDIFMRVLGEELHRRWGQPIVVENRPGGASNIGARACAEAPPDGYTI